MQSSMFECSVHICIFLPEGCSSGGLETNTFANGIREREEAPSIILLSSLCCGRCIGGTTEIPIIASRPVFESRQVLRIDTDLSTVIDEMKSTTGRSQKIVVLAFVRLTNDKLKMIITKKDVAPPKCRFRTFHARYRV